MKHHKRDKTKKKGGFTYLMRKPVIVVALLLVLLPASVFAVRGVGIKYGIEYAKFYSGQENCLTYKVYNPWDEDVAIELVAGGELEPFYDRTEPLFVPAGTKSDDAKPIEICFDIPKTSRRNCPDVRYQGEVIAKEASISGIEGTGSATSVVAAASLTIDLVCDSFTSSGSIVDTSLADIELRDTIYLLFGAVSAAALVFLVKFYRKRPQQDQKKYMRLYHELLQLQSDLAHDPNDQAKRQRYNDLWNQLQQMRQKF